MLRSGASSIASLPRSAIAEQQVRSHGCQGQLGQAKPKKARARLAMFNSNGQPLPEEAAANSNGQQLPLHTMSQRIQALFNSETMSDVVFLVAGACIPAHKLVLAVSSPIFRRKFFEDAAPMSMSGNLHPALLSSMLGRPVDQIVVEVDADKGAFTEFLRHIYTDKCIISLENVVALLHLADAYQVLSLTEQCHSFLHAAVGPSTCLSVLSILRIISMKACVGYWRDIVLRRRALERLRALSNVERRAKIQAPGADSWGESSRPSSRCSVMSMTKRDSTYSVCSVRFNDSDEENGSFAGFDALDKREEEAFLKDEHVNLQTMDPAITGRFIKGLAWRLSKCIQDETQEMLDSDSWLHSEPRNLKEVLQLELCSVKEIVIFQGMMRWAEARCRILNLPVTAEIRRNVLGDDNISLIRFPTMTPDEFQWQVIPTALLSYEDVQRLLAIMHVHGDGKHMPAECRYSTKPRSQWTLRAIRNSVMSSRRRSAPHLVTGTLPHDARPQHYKLIDGSHYKAAKGDDLDNLLGSELFKLYLSSSSERLRDTPDLDAKYSRTKLRERDPVSDFPSAEAASLSLPGLQKSWSSPGAAARQPRSARAHRGPRIHCLEGAAALAQRPHTSGPALRVTVGASRDTSKASMGASARPRPMPSDFDRLCQGLYRFRGQQLMELWLEAGEAMVKDHGFLGEVDASIDAQGIRELVGLPEAPPRGEGVPLAAFLCRQ